MPTLDGFFEFESVGECENMFVDIRISIFQNNTCICVWKMNLFINEIHMHASSNILLSMITIKLIDNNNFGRTVHYQFHHYTRL